LKKYIIKYSIENAITIDADNESQAIERFYGLPIALINEQIQGKDATIKSIVVA
jgi:hypothetical protein